mgnify:CR=1 FL=1
MGKRFESLFFVILDPRRGGDRIQFLKCFAYVK